MGSGAREAKRVIKSAAVYARISSDQLGEGLGVARQLEDCRKLAASRGWPVGQEYVDNDVSAYSGKDRPAYGRMLEDLRSGSRDAVIVYNLDRLHRRPVELESFISLCDEAGMHDVATVTADIDLGNDDGLFMARIFAAFAAKESGRKSARVKRELEQRALAGLPTGSRRAFGYEDDKTTIREPEAAIIRELVARLLAGESMRSLATWMNETGVPTMSGTSVWKTHTLRQILTSPRIAGLREHNGEIVGKAVWEPIITTDERERVLARLAARQRSGKRAVRRYLLSGMLRCGKCGNTLFSAARYEGVERRTRRYVCLKGPDHGGCGRLTVVAEPVEELITDAVLDLLDSPAVAKKMSGKESEDVETAALSEALTEDQRQLEELAALYAEKAITIREWIAARDPIHSRIRDLERRLAQATETTALAGFAGKGAELRAQWEETVLDRRCAVVRSVLDHAVIAPGTPGSRTLDIGRVQPVWKV
ncbi:MAG: recombinase family protein [Segniliparus sp.]|uniref:recombinase family protein n=1 Tax=Segniliparus sp. TaxID=2804064 RepID=UPI003F3FF643